MSARPRPVGLTLDVVVKLREVAELLGGPPREGDARRMAELGAWLDRWLDSQTRPAMAPPDAEPATEPEIEVVNMSEPEMLGLDVDDGDYIAERVARRDDEPPTNPNDE